MIHRERLMLDAVRDIRIEDPGIGCYKLWIMLRSEERRVGKEC